MKPADKNAEAARKSTLAMQKVVSATKRLDVALQEAIECDLDIYLDVHDTRDGDECALNFYRSDQRLGAYACGVNIELPDLRHEFVGNTDEE